MIANHLFFVDDDVQTEDSYATYDKKKKKGATGGGADGAEGEGESKGFSKKCKIVTGVAVVLVILVIALVLIIGALKPKVPDAPASLTRDDKLTGTTEVAFTWDAPTDNGGEEVIDYTVQMMTDEEAFSDASTGQNQTSFKLDKGISAGKTYTFRVRARNSVGFSDYSSELPIIAATTPDASPSDVANDRTQTATNQLTISWEAPSKSGDGGSPIIDYTVEQLDEQTGNFTEVQSGLTTTSCTISDLTESTSYTFRVLARNAVGLGEPSSEVTIATLMGDIGDFYLSGLSPGDTYDVYVNSVQLFAYKGQETVNGTYVRNMLQSIVTGDD